MLRPLGTASRFPADALRHLLLAVPEHAWGPLSTLDQSGIHDGYRVAPLVVAGRAHPLAERFALVLDAFAPVWSAWLSWLAPDGFILTHRDAGPYHERWQVPILPAGAMNNREAVAGEAFRVLHWEPHSVINRTDRPRVHVVIDRELVLDATEVPFQRFEEVPE